MVLKNNRCWCTPGFVLQNQQCVKSAGKAPPSNPKPTVRAPPQQRPSGGGGGRSSGGGGSAGGGSNIWPGIACHTGCGGGGKGPNPCPSGECLRLQYGVKNNTPTVDFRVKITIPPDYSAKDTATLQVGGSQHSGDCNVNRYKAYVGINGGKNGFDYESGSNEHKG